MYRCNINKATGIADEYRVNINILSGYVLLYPGIAAVQILSIVLLIVGIERIAIGTFSPYHRKSSSRFSNIGLGVYPHVDDEAYPLCDAYYKTAV